MLSFNSSLVKPAIVSFRSVEDKNTDDLSPLSKKNMGPGTVEVQGERPVPSENITPADLYRTALAARGPVIWRKDDGAPSAEEILGSKLPPGTVRNKDGQEIHKGDGMTMEDLTELIMKNGPMIYNADK